MIVAYFTELFSQSATYFPPQLDGLILVIIMEEHNVRLCRIPDDSEIWDAVKAIGSTKAPGPDGFTAIFFQHYWPQVKSEVIAMVKAFFTSDFLLKQLFF